MAVLDEIKEAFGGVCSECGLYFLMTYEEALKIRLGIEKEKNFCPGCAKSYTIASVEGDKMYDVFDILPRKDSERQWSRKGSGT